jgi:hypothetical protein
MPAFVIYCAVALFAAYEARVVASRAENNKAIDNAPDTAAAVRPRIETTLSESPSHHVIDRAPDALQQHVDSARGARLSGNHMAPSLREADIHRGAEPFTPGGK